MRGMRFRYIFLFIGLFSGFLQTSNAQSEKLRIFVVNSYHREYLWEQEANVGFCKGLLDFRFLDTQDQADVYTQKDFVETDKIVLKRAWMDSKRKNSKEEMAQASLEILSQIKAFRPDLIIVGDDNASNYIGNQYVDSDTPVLFRGIVGTPMKYGLADSVAHPGHNITGVLKPGYPKDTLDNFVKLIPGLKTFAILGDASETSRAKAKEIVQLEESGDSPLKLTETVLTNSYEDWQAAVLRLSPKVDAFYILNINTLKDKQEAVLDPLALTAWYLSHVKKPECVWEKQFVQQGYLFTADNSAYTQGYEVARMADMVIHQKKNPADISCEIPPRGKIMVNRQRAQALGIDLKDKAFIEAYEDKSLALEKYPQ